MLLVSVQFILAISDLIFSETADFSFTQLIPGRKAEYLVFRHDQAEAEIQTVADLLIAEFWSKNPSKNLLHHYLGALKVLLLQDAAASAKASQPDAERDLGEF